jgi:hypothetical protein
MRHKLGCLLDELAVDGVLYATLNNNCDGFIHLIAGNGTYSFLT